MIELIAATVLAIVASVAGTLIASRLLNLNRSSVKKYLGEFVEKYREKIRERGRQKQGLNKPEQHDPLYGPPVPESILIANPKSKLWLIPLPLKQKFITRFLAIGISCILVLPFLFTIGITIFYWYEGATLGDAISRTTNNYRLITHCPLEYQAIEHYNGPTLGDTGRQDVQDQFGENWTERVCQGELLDIKEPPFWETIWAAVVIAWGEVIKSGEKATQRIGDTTFEEFSEGTKQSGKTVSSGILWFLSRLWSAIWRTLLVLLASYFTQYVVIDKMFPENGWLAFPALALIAIGTIVWIFIRAFSS